MIEFLFFNKNEGTGKGQASATKEKNAQLFSF